MSYTLLKCVFSGESLQYDFGGQRFKGPERKDLEKYVTDKRRVWSRGWSDPGQAIAWLQQGFRKYVLPSQLEDALRAWAALAKEPTLGVECIDELVASVPWELAALTVSNEQLLVIRISAQKASSAQSSDKLDLVLAGWPNIGPNLPGIERELVEIPKMLSGSAIRAKPLPNPTFDELQRVISIADRPTIIHLSPPGILQKDDEFLIGMTSKAPAKPGSVRRKAQLIPTSELIGAFVKHPHSSVVCIILNTCNGGQFMARQLSARLGVPVVAWAGFTSDDLAVQFAMFFYQRLLEGATLAETVRAFIFDVPLVKSERSAILMLWLPSVESVSQQILARRKHVAPNAQDVTAADETTRSAVVSVSEREQAANECADDGSGTDFGGRFRPLGAINPALLKNGRPTIQSLEIFNPRESCRIRLEITCDTGLGSSTFRQTVLLRQRGWLPVDTKQMHFPALHELMRQRAERRRVNFQLAAYDHHGKVLYEATKSSLWMSHNEWMDQRDTWAFIPAFVQPESKGVRAVFERAEDVLRDIGKPTDHFEAYGPRGAPQVCLQIRAIYQAVRSMGIRYTLPGMTVFNPDGADPVGQRVRTSDEVVESRSGTCHDLALLLASCAESRRIWPLLVLRPGHTLVGFWKAESRQRSFWEQSSPMRFSDPFGSGWMIQDRGTLQELVKSDAIELVEAEMVTQSQTSFEEACRVYMTKDRMLDNLDSDKPLVVVDVLAARPQIQPL
jgi:hypothetical protein